MRNLPPKWRYFLEDSRWLINIALILALINLFTFITSGNSTPWFLIPVFFMSLWLIPDFIDTLFGEDEGDEVEEILEHDEATKQTDTPKNLADATIQVHLAKAQAYKQQIDALIKSTSNQNIRKRLQELSSQLNEWTQAIEVMAEHVDSFQRNTLILQDLETLPRAIDKLKAQLAKETDEMICAELERTLTKRKNQLAILEQLQGTMRRAEIKIENTLASIGILYSQLLAGYSTDQIADYSRLSDEVNEEIRTLQDHLEALEEVKLGRSRA